MTKITFWSGYGALAKRYQRRSTMSVLVNKAMGAR